MEVKITKETETFARNNKMEIYPYGEGVVFIDYNRGIYGEESLTAKVIAKLKKDNPSLMVTAVAAFITSISSLGAIVNFEEKP